MNREGGKIGKIDLCLQVWELATSSERRRAASLTFTFEAVK